MNNSENRRPLGIGAGYLSIMMIFVVLCMTMLAALSYSSASAENRYSRRSGEYTQEYYAADLEAKRVLAEIDGIASGYSDYSDFMFLAELDGLENVEYSAIPGGTEIYWQTPINDRQSISSAVRYSVNGYTVTEWKTVSAYEPESKPLNVWSGE